jgi:enoyl-CoA hydratase/carnithine racemase
LLTGEMIAADEALSWGLVEAVAPPEALDAAVERLAAQILAGGPNAIRIQKALILDWEEAPSASAAVRRGIERFVETFDSDEPARMAGSRLAEMRAAKRSG